MAETADSDTAHRRADSPLLLVLFCSLILRYAHIIGALCVGYSCSVGCSSNAALYSVSMASLSICALLTPADSASLFSLSLYSGGRNAWIDTVFSALYRAIDFRRASVVLYSFSCIITHPKKPCNKSVSIVTCKLYILIVISSFHHLSRNERFVYGVSIDTVLYYSHSQGNTSSPDHDQHRTQRKDVHHEH